MTITAVVFEGCSLAGWACAYQVAKGWVSKLVARYRAEGDAAFEPHSRRPHSSPGELDSAVVELIVALRVELAGQGLDAGGDTIAWPLQHRHQTRVSTSTIHRYLRREGLVTPEPKRRPKSCYVHFAEDLPKCWQADFTRWRLVMAPTSRSGPGSLTTPSRSPTYGTLTLPLALRVLRSRQIRKPPPAMAITAVSRKKSR